MRTLQQTMITGTVNSAGLNLTYLIEGEGYPFLLSAARHTINEIFARDQAMLGKYDFLTGPTCLGDEIKSHFNKITIEVFEKSAHSPQQEEAELFNEVFRN